MGDADKGQDLKNFIKFGIIGILNTLICLGTIRILLAAGFNPYTSNVIGYVAGFLNSFLMNKFWNFRSDGSVWNELVLFFITFLFCWSLNVLVLKIALLSFQLPEWYFSVLPETITTIFNREFMCQIFANIVYTVCSFILYKKLVFKKS